MPEQDAPTPDRVHRRARLLFALGAVALGAVAIVVYGLLAWVHVPFAGLSGGLGLVLWLESQRRYGWADGYCAALKYLTERERADG